jgi:hypothetical protein
MERIERKIFVLLDLEGLFEIIVMLSSCKLFLLCLMGMDQLLCHIWTFSVSNNEPCIHNWSLFECLMP